jgi:flagellar biogenesis protein FliO
VRFILAFAVVVALAALASRWLAGQARGLQRSSFALLGGIALGGQRQVCAVRVGRRVLILGLGDKQVSLLDSITDPEEIALIAATPPAPRGPSSAAFTRALGQALRRGSAERAVAGVPDPRRAGGGPNG